MMKRLCHYCEEKSARHLLRIDRAVNNTPGSRCAEPFFCSEQCAAKYGVSEVLARGIYWCDKHGWYVEDCYDCIAEKRESG